MTYSLRLSSEVRRTYPAGADDGGRVKVHSAAPRLGPVGGCRTADVRKWESKKLGVVIEVDYDKCSGIGECVSVCPSTVYEVVDGKATCPNIDECVQCCACQEACPVKAIKHHSCQ
jgi:NAD-dependent dihydropyrimidine dehydrogenase PreA subunit